jgi:hypothetical protein
LTVQADGQTISNEPVVKITNAPFWRTRQHSLLALPIFRGLIFQMRLASRIFGTISAVAFIHATAMADDEASPAATNATIATDSRHGLFDWLDPRSAYNQEFFPTPLLVDETSLEQDGELELNSLHTEANNLQSGVVTAEVEKSLGQLTLELAVPYERDSDASGITQGIGNIELGARYPVYQFVTASGFFDTTLGVAMEAGIPVQSAVSQNSEFEPKIFNDLKLGEHFSLQSVFGYSILFGGGDNGGLQTLEYGFAFAYVISHSELPLPGVQRFTPLFELVGETELNRDDAGGNSLLGCIGFRADLKPIEEVQPSLGLGYVFPVDSGARSEVHWGIATSLTFEF